MCSFADAIFERFERITRMDFGPVCVLRNLDLCRFDLVLWEGRTLPLLCNSFIFFFFTNAFLCLFVGVNYIDGIQPL